MFTTKATERIAALERQIGQLQATVQWLQAHVNQVQAERSVLLERVLGLGIPTPAIMQSPGMSAFVSGAADDRRRTNQRSAEAAANDPVEPFDLVAAFEDMGDEEAERQRIAHTPDGFVVR